MKKTTFLFNLLATTALATSAHAGVINGSGWSFNSDTGVLEITGDVQYQGVTGHVDGDSLPGLGAKMSSVTSIRFGEGVTHVSGFSHGDYSFTSVSFPSTLEKIADNAFASDSALTSVTFDQGATGLDIGYGAFSNCYNISRLELPDNVKLHDGSLSVDDGLTVVLGKMDEGELDQYSLSSAGLVFCPDETCKGKVMMSDTGFDADNIKMYTKDSDGVYTDEDGVMYASAQDMIAGDTCGMHDACVTALGGNSGSGSSGGSGGSGGSGSSGGSGGSNNSGSQSEPKRIYTLEEARQAVEASGKETVNVRIRYK